MVDVLRIKRRAAGGAAGPPATLEASALAFNEQDNTLYYGKGNSAGLATSILAVGGQGLAANVYISDTAPTIAHGLLWFDSVSSRLFIGYNDGTSTKWIGVA